MEPFAGQNAGGTQQQSVEVLLPLLMLSNRFVKAKPFLAEPEVSECKLLLFTSFSGARSLCSVGVECGDGSATTVVAQQINSCVSCRLRLRIKEQPE